MADRYLCVHCRKQITATNDQRFRQHKRPGHQGHGDSRDYCAGGGEFVPANQLALGPIPADADPGTPVEGRDFGRCPECSRTVPLSERGGLAGHIVNRQPCLASYAPYQPPETSCPPTNAAENGPTASTAEPVSVTAAAFQQPAKTFLRTPEAPAPMTDLGQQITGRLKEMFYDYNNRRTADNRNAQATLGPSEIGTGCDRRLAMSLLRMEPVNPGGDGWAAFVGTQIHVGLADMFTWANAGTGRYAVEVPLKYANVYVPRGTGDLLDRTLCLFADHKAMGRWSLDKLRSKGPSRRYRVQVHTYAYGARLKGEKVDHVAIIAWPREAASLDDLYVWTERYDPTVALEALTRVDRIATAVTTYQSRNEYMPKGTVAAQFPVDNSECRYCPFYAPGDQKGERGCNGKE